MSDDRDILGKADALLRRHVPPRSESVDDVPVLTELISPGAALSAFTPLEDAPPDPVQPPNLAGNEEALKRELVAEVVNAVQSRIAQDFERRLTQHLVGEVKASVAAALGDLQQDIANAVGVAVDEALARRHGK